jgi:hypothetical protein
MLFKAKPNGVFRKAAIGGSIFIDDSKAADWPSDPIHIEDGVPFLIVAADFLAGHAELATDYVKYCMTECEWSDFKYEPKTKEQMRKALDSMIEKRGLKEYRKVLEKQIE